jgi:hypothetical protein
MGLSFPARSKDNGSWASYKANHKKSNSVPCSQAVEKNDGSKETTTLRRRVKGRAGSLICVISTNREYEQCFTGYVFKLAHHFSLVCSRDPSRTRLFRVATRAQNLQSMPSSKIFFMLYGDNSNSISLRTMRSLTIWKPSLRKFNSELSSQLHLDSDSRAESEQASSSYGPGIVTGCTVTRTGHFV